MKTSGFSYVVLISTTCSMLAATVGACSAEQNNLNASGDGVISISDGNTANGGASSITGAGAAVAFGSGGRGQVASTGTAATEICAKKNVIATRKPINLILVVDRSTTMGINALGLNTRWGALWMALFAEPDGLVVAYQSSVRFGFEGFTGFPPDDCPNLVSVPYALNNAQNIQDVFNSFTTIPTISPPGQTPTGEALKVIIDKLEPQVTRGKGSLDVAATADPFYMLIASDGLPDTCAVPNAEDNPTANPEAQQTVIDEVKRARHLGITTFVLSVGDDISDAHLQAVANAGIGAAKAPFWKVNDDQGLRDALSAIIGSASSCQLNLEGKITDTKLACQSGSVVLNSKPLSCDDQDGWRVVSPTAIELVGPACNTYKNNLKAILSIKFPCDVYVLK